MVFLNLNVNKLFNQTLFCRYGGAEPGDRTMVSVPI